MNLLRQSTAATITIGPILAPDGTEYGSAVIGDISLRKSDSSSSAALASAAALTADDNGCYKLELIAGNVDTVGRFQLFCNKDGYQMPPYNAMVLHANVYDALVGSVALATATNITGGTITTVTNLTNAPTNGDLTATMKTSVTTAAGAVTGDTGVTLLKAIEMIAAEACGKVAVSSAGGVSTYTYKKRDGTTTSFTVLASETDGTRATTGSLS